MQRSLFDVITDRKYPGRPGHKETDGETSREAADALQPRVRKLRQRVFGAIVCAGADGLTTDECATKIGETVLAVRPRFTELKRGLLIEKTHRRRKNISGRAAAVWRVRELNYAD